MLDGMTNIKAREVLKELKDYTEDLPHYSPDEVAEALEMAIKALEQTTWIPVSKRLPEDKQGCIVTVQGDSKTFIDIVTYYAEEHSFLYYEECNVLAWMPLPQPYREGDAE